VLHEARHDRARDGPPGDAHQPVLRRDDGSTLSLLPGENYLSSEDARLVLQWAAARRATALDAVRASAPSEA